LQPKGKKANPRFKLSRSRSTTRMGQRGRGRSGGRAVSERGRIRRRPSGGGTLRRNSPQQGQRPSLAIGPVTSARSQWPRASHSGLMHCTVNPGKYCIVSPQRPKSPACLHTLCHAPDLAGPLAAMLLAAAPPRVRLAQPSRGLKPRKRDAREQSIRWRAFCPEPSLVSRGKHHKILW